MMSTSPTSSFRLLFVRLGALIAVVQSSLVPLSLLGDLEIGQQIGGGPSPPNSHNNNIRGSALSPVLLNTPAAYQKFLKENASVLIDFSSENGDIMILESEWQAFTKRVQTKGIPLVTATIDCTLNKSLCIDQAGVSQYPTMRIIDKDRNINIDSHGRKTTLELEAMADHFFGGEVRSKSSSSRQRVGGLRKKSSQ